jgi:hypothetical protein
VKGTTPDAFVSQGEKRGELDRNGWRNHAVTESDVHLHAELRGPEVLFEAGPNSLVLGIFLDAVGFDAVRVERDAAVVDFLRRNLAPFRMNSSTYWDLLRR